MKLPLLLLAFIPWYSAQSQPAVKVAGALRNIMWRGNLSAQVSLDTLPKQHLFALGPVAGLKGEIMVVDGKPIITGVADTQLKTDTTFGHQAAMLVYSYVSNWKSIDIDTDINTYQDLERVIGQQAQAHKLDGSRPFVFMVKCHVRNVKFHIIDWRDGETHTPDNHKQFAHDIHETDTGIMLLGFYSTQHQGVFTHHTSHMHVHAATMTQNPRICGHLDDIATMDGFTLFLPQ